MFCGGLGGDEGKLGREVVGIGEEIVPPMQVQYLGYVYN